MAHLEAFSLSPFLPPGVRSAVDAASSAFRMQDLCWSGNGSLGGGEEVNTQIQKGGVNRGIQK